MTFKPMLAGAPKNAADWASVTYPKLQSAKLDGFRVLTTSQGAVTRKLLPLANVYTRNKLSDPLLHGLDGECLVADASGSISDPLIYNRTQSQLASFDGEPNFVYMVFDYFLEPDLPFAERLQKAEEIVFKFNSPNVRMVKHDIVETWEDVQKHTADLVAQGYEGSMLRDPNGRYKYGRSTVREQGLLKVKNYFMEQNVVEEEATIVRLDVLESNRNLPEKDLLGRSKRSSHKANMIPVGTMGAIWVSSPSYKEQFKIGSGFSEEQRQAIWDNASYYIGKTVTFKHQVEGAYESPRFPVFVRMHECSDPSDFVTHKTQDTIRARKLLLDKISSAEELYQMGYTHLLDDINRDTERLRELGRNS